MALAVAAAAGSVRETMRIRLFAALLTALLVQEGAAAKPVPAPTLLAPSGPWVVEFADSMCLLSRTYLPDKSITLIVKPEMIGDNFELVVVKAAKKTRDFRYGEAVLATATGTSHGPMRFSAYSTETARLVRVKVDGATLPFEKLEGSISVDAKDEAHYALAIPQFVKTLPVMKKCARELRAFYKVTDADLAAVETHPQGNIVGLFSSDDCPREALDKDQSGNVGVLLWVETDGRVSKCEIIERSAAESLNRKTCEVFERAKFTPAQDAQGRAVRAPSFHRITWRTSA